MCSGKGEVGAPQNDVNIMIGGIQDRICALALQLNFADNLEIVYRISLMRRSPLMPLHRSSFVILSKYSRSITIIDVGQRSRALELLVLLYRL